MVAVVLGPITARLHGATHAKTCKFTTEVSRVHKTHALACGQPLEVLCF